MRGRVRLIAVWSIASAAGVACGYPSPKTTRVSLAAPVPCAVPKSASASADPAQWARPIPDLETCAATPRFREVRVSTYMELSASSHTLRLVDADGAVWGAVYVGYFSAPNPTEAAPVRNCAVVSAVVEQPTIVHTTCRVRLEEEPDWAALLALFDREDVWTLRDPEGLDEHEELIRDGEEITINTRRGADIGRYSYRIPDSTVSPSRARAIRAARAAEVVIHCALQGAERSCAP